MTMTKEAQRLQDARDKKTSWKKWGPYLSERQWGMVREDYSPDGNAWDYFTHDQARSRAYRWGEDGLEGISDDMPQALAGMLWTKQYDSFTLDAWLGEHKARPLFQPTARMFRNRDWFHMVNDDIISWWVNRKDPTGKNVFEGGWGFGHGKRK